MSVVQIKDLKKQFGNVTAVDDVSLSIKKGEFLVILGPSGSGKSTLLRMIAGLEKPTAGDIIIGDQVVTKLPPRVRHIAMVFQSYALYPHMKIFDNIAFPLRAQGGFSKEEIAEKVQWAASTLGIAQLLDRKPRQLSGGERQRVALARALVKEPTVLLLDEPLSNLDAKLRASARDELQQFQRRLGITTIFVTHDQVEAMGLGDRIVVMHLGKVVQVGTPEEIYNHSANTFVATFLGSPGMNLIDCGDYLLGFRPENFHPAAIVKEADQAVTFSFMVDRVEYLGADRLLYGVIQREGLPSTRTLARLPSTVSLPLEPSKTYEFVIREEDLRFFDKQTENRIEPQPL